jgi:plastocyanin
VVVVTRTAPIAVMLSCAALVTGCAGGREETVATPAPTGSAPTQDAPAGEATEGAVEVKMVNFEFDPRDVTVEQGATITWLNEDSVQHDAVAREGEGPDSELFNQGESYSWTADVEPGEIPYVCTIHPGMEGTITVR